MPRRVIWGQPARAGQPDGERRQDQRGDPPGAECRHPPELHREHDDQQVADPERRGAYRRHREAEHGVVGEAPLPPGGHHPHGHGHQHGHRGCPAHQLEGGRQPFQHQLRGRLALPERLAEVTDRHAGDEVPVLHAERPVQPENGPAAGPMLRGGLQRQRHRGRVGEDVGDHKDQGGDDEDHQRGGDDAFSEPPKQRAPSRRATTGPRPGPSVYRSPTFLAAPNQAARCASGPSLGPLSPFGIP